MSYFTQNNAMASFPNESQAMFDPCLTNISNAFETGPVKLPSNMPNGNGIPQDTTSQLELLSMLNAQTNLSNKIKSNSTGVKRCIEKVTQDDSSTTRSENNNNNKASNNDDASASTGTGGEPKSKRRKRAKKPEDMPRRALSAYNIFFSEQRDLILKEIDAKSAGKDAEGSDSEDNSFSLPSSAPDVLNRTFFPKRKRRAHRKVHGKISLVVLARKVSQRWKDLSDEQRKYYQNLADEDKKRHKQAMVEYYQKKAAENILAANAPSPTILPQQFSQMNSLQSLNFMSQNMNNQCMNQPIQNNFFNQQRIQQEETQRLLALKAQLDAMKRMAMVSQLEQRLAQRWSPFPSQHGFQCE